MAKDQELGLRVTLKGMDRAKRGLSGFRKVLNSLKGKAEGAAGVVRGEGREGRGGGGGGGGGGDRGGGGRFGSTMMGTLMGNMISGGFRSFQQHMQGVFDPNLTSTERQMNTAKAVLSSVPVVGDLASSYLEGSAAAKVGAAQGTAQRLNSIFGPAFQAYGAANPNATIDDYKDRFGPQIERLRSRIEREERGQEIGSQLIADMDPGFTPEDLEAMRKKAIEDAKGQFASTEKAIKDVLGKYATAWQNIQENTTSMDKALNQIKDYWLGEGSPIKGLFQ